MGDAGPPTPEPLLGQGTTQINNTLAQDDAPLREVRVLVTGFGVGSLSLSVLAALLPFALCMSWLGDSALTGWTGGDMPSAKILSRERKMKQQEESNASIPTGALGCTVLPCYPLLTCFLSLHPLHLCTVNY